MSTASQSAADDALDLVFGALANRTRRSLLARIAERPAAITDLAEPFDMSFPAVSKHLRVLERAGLVRRSVDGRVHRCSLDAAPLENADAWLEHYRTFWESTLDSLERHVTETNP